MPPKPTPNPRAEADRERDTVLVEMFDKLAADDPAWAAQLPQAVHDALARRRRSPTP